jgi:hypothetical protein
VGDVSAWLLGILPAVTEWFGKNLVALAALGFGLDWLHRYRTQERTRTELQLANDIITPFFQFSDAVKQWGAGVLDLDRFQGMVSAQMAPAVTAQARAITLFEPAISSRMDRMFWLISQIKASEMAVQTYRKSGQGAEGTQMYMKEIEAAERKSRRIYPVEFLVEYQRLVRDLQALFHGKRKAQAWAKERERIERAEWKGIGLIEGPTEARPATPLPASDNRYRALDPVKLPSHD